jgi:hypothetical protein
MAGKTFKEQSTSEIYHWYQATSTFRSKLSGPLTSSERDALWITSVLLSIISIASIDATTPEEAWPLKPSSSTDLNWLEMAHGKNVVWGIANLARPDSVLGVIVTGSKEPSLDLVTENGGLNVLPKELLELLNLDTSARPERNPYYCAALYLGNLLGLEPNLTTIHLFYAWLFMMETEYKRLLTGKDPCALLLLAYWFAKVRTRQVWCLWQRSVLECEAICIYLERNHADLPHLKTLLQFPKGGS